MENSAGAVKRDRYPEMKEAIEGLKEQQLELGALVERITRGVNSIHAEPERPSPDVDKKDSENTLPPTGLIHEELLPQIKIISDHVKALRLAANKLDKIA